VARLPPGPLVQGLAAAAAAAAGVGRGEVVVALPLGLQPQLVAVVLDVRLLLQRQTHLPGRREREGDQETRM